MHAVHSPIAVDNSTVTMSRTVTFINNTVGNDQYYSMCGGAILFNSAYSLHTLAPNSFFIISAAGADVCFINSTAAYCGGAIYLKSTMMTINSNVNMTLTGNYVHIVKVDYVSGIGGAMYIQQSNVTVKTGPGALLLITKYSAHQGGAVYLTESSIFFYGCNDTLFANNIIPAGGGAIYMMWNSEISVDAHSRLIFYNNSAYQGGAVYVQNQANVRVGSDSY